MKAKVGVLVSVIVLGLVFNGAYASLHPGGGDEYHPGLERPSFEEVASERSLSYTTNSSGIENGGVFVTDFDNDRWPDVLAVGGDHPVLFENEEGSFEPSGALPRVYGQVKTALVLDYDNDGWEDLILFRVRDTPVFLENSRGTFERRSVGFEAELAVPKSATAADYNDDGCLDVFVAQNADWDNSTPRGARLGNHTEGGEDEPEDEDTDNGRPNYLYRGDCSSFARADDAGIRGRHWSLAASFADLTGDGRPDIHVANDFYNDVVYLNRGNDTFERSVLGPETDRNGMSSEVADVDGDGDLDIFVTNIYLPPLLKENKPPLKERAKGNNLLVNTGNGTFAYRGVEYGVHKGGWGWAAVLGDFDNDMDRDLFHTTDTVDVPVMLRALQREGYNSVSGYKESHPYLMYPVIWERNGSEFRARSPTELGFEKANGTGVAGVDYDRDGDLDLVVSRSTGPVDLYENTLDKGRSVKISIESAPGRPALGARVYVTVDGHTQLRAANAKADFLSQDPRVLHVGLGEHATVDRIRVVWPDGRERVVRNVTADSRVVITPGEEVRVISYPGTS